MEAVNRSQPPEDENIQRQPNNKGPQHINFID